MRHIIFFAFLIIARVITTVQGIGTIIPLYLYPQVNNGVHNWQKLIDAKATYPTVDIWAIVNQNSGPGNSKDPNYVDAINRLKAAGIPTLGYVSTNYAVRDSADVKQDIRRWKSMYSPNGIFFDEMKYEACSSCVRYYSSLNNYAKSLNFTFTVGNPGVDTLPQFANTLDTIMIYESAGAYPTTANYGGWHDSYPKNKWGIFPYNIQNLNSTLIQDAKQHVGFIYLTDDNLPNPWDSLPPYLNELLKLLSCNE